MPGSDLDLPLESRLCLSCGLCCDGTVYGFAIIREDEIEDADRIGMQVMRTVTNAPSFVMGCHYLDGACCTRYDQWRPSICGEYFCRVQIRARKAELTEDEAFGRIAEARRLADQVRELLPPHVPMSQARHYFKRLAAKQPNLTPEETRFVVRMFVLEKFLDSEFRDPRSGHLPQGQQGQSPT